MDELKRRILAEGIAVGEGLLRVDSFLNQQVDPALMAAIGREFAQLAAPLSPDRIATAEASGIAPALATAQAMSLPLTIFKKAARPPEGEGFLSEEVASFTKREPYRLTVRAEYVPAGARVLFVDDFLAAGEAARGAVRLIEAGGAIVAGLCFAVEKAFQGGRERLAGAGYAGPILSLARIARLTPRIEFLSLRDGHSAG